MILRILTALVLASPLTILAQGFGLGLNPSNMNWRQIDTDKVQVVYPEGLEPRAQRAANLIHMLYDSSYYPLGDMDNKITVIVQNQTTISNGFVSPFGPIRTEFFTTPPQFSFLGNVDWWDALTIHEYRHVEQVWNARRGWTKIMSYLFGQNGLGGGAGLAMPRWFFEGDATFYETQLTTAGRGRTPDFDKQYRSLMLDDKFYGYEKASAFSLRDFVPNHYAQGYYMTTHIRRKYGHDAMTAAAQNATAYRTILYPFSWGLKKHTGKTAPKLYRETFLELQKEWKEESEQIELTESDQVNNKEKKAFTSYQLPVFVSESELIVEKRGFQDIRQFYRIDAQGNEKRLFTPGLSPDLNAIHTVQKDVLVWTELAYDERWGNQDFSILRRLNLNEKVPRKLTTRTKYFAPDLSKDASKIVVVEAPETTIYGLHILNAYNGDVLQKISNPDNYFFSFPKWIDDSRIVSVIQKNSRNALAIIDTETNTITPITTWRLEQISYPRPSGDYIFFSSTLSGIDNIHVWDQSRNQEFQVTSTLLGAVQPAVSPSGQKLAFSEFTSEGWNLKTMDIDPGSWRPIQSKYVTEIDFYQPVDDYGSILDKVPTTTYPTKKYNKNSGFINLHSWSPIAIHPDYGGAIFVGNKFSTWSASGTYQYNVNERGSTWSTNATYAEFYPVLQVGFQRSDRSRSVLIYEENIPQVDVPTLGIEAGDTIARTTRIAEWTENDLNAGILLPLNITSGNHFGSLELRSMYHALTVDYRTPLETDSDVLGGLSVRGVPVDFGEYQQPEERVSESFSAMELGLSFSHFQTRARQQVLPRWGQLLNIDYLRTVGSDNNEGEYFQINTRWFFPGLVKTHGFSIRGGFRQEDANAQYKFRDIFSYARGYNVSLLSDNVWVAGVDYSFPIWLPDVALGPFAFIKRIKGTVFFDYSEWNRNPVSVRDLRRLTTSSFALTSSTFDVNVVNRSVGLDLRFDVRLFRILEADFGARYAYLLDADEAGLDQHRILPIVFTVGF